MILKIRKTKMNIFWLLLLGLAVGVIIGIRQPLPEQSQKTALISQGEVK